MSISIRAIRYCPYIVVVVVVKKTRFVRTNIVVSTRPLDDVSPCNVRIGVRRLKFLVEPGAIKVRYWNSAESFFFTGKH